MFVLIKKGISTGWEYRKTVGIVYLLQLLLALSLGMQVSQVMEASIGQSLELDKLLAGYSHTVWMDFLNVHGASLSSLLGQLRWVLAAYVLFSVFIHGGILHSVVKRQRGWRAFWTGGAVCFFPFLKIAMVTAVAMAVWSALLWLPFLSQANALLEVLPSEKTLFALLLLLLMVWLVGVFFLFIASLSARTAWLAEGLRTWRSLWNGYRFALRNWGKTNGICLIFLLFQVVLWGVYLLLENASGMISPALIVVFFLLQQAVVLLRLASRVMLYGALAGFYQSKQKTEETYAERPSLPLADA